jgi:WD40 repeat protein
MIHTIIDLHQVPPPITLDGHAAGVWDANYSADGRLIVTVGPSEWWTNMGRRLAREIRIWDAAAGEQRVALEGHSAGIVLCEFSPDSKLLVTSSIDGMAKIWDVEELLEYGKQQASFP